MLEDAYPQLPVELLEHITSFLQDDTRALRNLSLSSRTLDAVSKPHLFATIDFRRLGCPELRPLFCHVKELQVTWQVDMFQTNEMQLLDRLLVPSLSPEALPRLQRLVVRALGTRGTRFLSMQRKAFVPLTSLTTLTLWETYHQNLRDVQMLICALPYLKTLHFSTVSWGKDLDYIPLIPEPLPDGPHLETLYVSSTYPEKTLVLVGWLAQTPTGQSLKNLHIPFFAHNAPALVPFFGPMVQCLSVPVRRLHASSLARYTSLESLVLLLHKYHPGTGRWEELPIVLASLPSSGLLRSLTLQLELERLHSDEELSDAVLHNGPLQEADRVLFPESGTDDGATQFANLCEVSVVVRTSFSPTKSKRDEFEGVIRRLMQRTVAHGQLVLLFEAA
ncbi:hypothetical protein L226DRAFT_53108 [Lentinus tigrinus ALCF2SS1-7]|uniref:F-box domain-containing protein n=1 Tax=Lentinus tigrinus ALCF2SS1-6 TaxID=1328759 RepID=A0A5C2SAU4_9APHY|nr:hypothetical protein L227DRAFT_610546 [Lentinus tigrinus ALCF2SS1-6]RPD75029.1 hypothetical protein L226DRAFT_53108 [Lentinus tigrinus ALCF2SS1-7]